MKASQRREKIISILKEESQAVSASALAEQLQVSRQVIVGDIALLRAQGRDILSTPRGYILDLNMQKNGESFIVACCHSAELARDEIYAIVDNGGELLDVIVEHPIYGQIIGQLNISSRYDTDLFINKIKTEKVNLLSYLTDGIHLHTISCGDEKTANRIKNILKQMNILLCENN